MKKVKIITSWSVLITLAKKLGKAKKGGNGEEIKKAESDLREYEKIVKESDEMIL